MSQPLLKALLVDLDGTLADTVGALYELYRNLLTPYGIIGTEAEFSELNGKSLKEIVAFLKARYHLPVAEEKFFEDYQSYVRALYQEIPLFPFVDQTLEMVKEAGVKLVLVTSAHMQLARLFLESHDLTLDAIQTSEGLPGKPSPEIYKSALQLAGVGPELAVAIEDSENGFKAAAGAGIYTLRLDSRVKGVEWNKGYAGVQDWEVIYKILAIVYGLSDF